MHACSHFYFISGLCANIGGFVISCDNEDTNHLERKGMGGKGKWGEGQGRMRKEEKGSDNVIYFLSNLLLHANMLNT